MKKLPAIQDPTLASKAARLKSLAPTKTKAQRETKQLFGTKLERVPLAYRFRQGESNDS